MNCALCDTVTIGRKSDYLCQNKIIGDVIVPHVDVEECPSCGEIMLSGAAEAGVSRYVEILEREAVVNLPARDLINAGQAAAILGVTKQAFSKNPKIKKGFVYFITIGTKNFFFRSSLELYKTAGDGRFPITKWKSSAASDCNLVCNTADNQWQQINSSVETGGDAAYRWDTSVQERR